ncbi:GFA family protein [Rhizobium sullae]|uniref:GFA family protein n=1 Tax=Rhizobium sullae TaxID=50338 RepID=UPI000B35073C|nr:GFA family protein [Rhizobium sullae]
MKKTYHGSCHCGAIRYETRLDLSAGTFRCNCSICMKKRNWLAVAQPEDFRLLSGEEKLGEYQFASRKLHHLFCKDCGISSYSWGENEHLGTFYAIAVSCLDDATAKELIAAPIAFVDGLRDRYDGPPEETRHL